LLKDRKCAVCKNPGSKNDYSLTALRERTADSTANAPEKTTELPARKSSHFHQGTKLQNHIVCDAWAFFCVILTEPRLKKTATNYLTVRERSNLHDPFSHKKIAALSACKIFVL